MDIQPIGNTPLTAPVRSEASTAGAAPQTQVPAAPVQTAEAVQQAPQVPNMQQLAAAVKDINKAVANQGIEFSIDSDSGKTIVKIVEQGTNKVVRQIPSEDAMEIAKALEKAQQGLLIRQKA